MERPLLPVSDRPMWSGESEAQKSRYTSDNYAAWLKTGAFLIALKIWQKNAGNCNRMNLAFIDVRIWSAIAYFFFCFTLHILVLWLNVCLLVGKRVGQSSGVMSSVSPSLYRFPHLNTQLGHSYHGSCLSAGV